MTKAVQKITLFPSRDVPFNKLVLSQSNVRHVKAGISVEQLAESIAQQTVLQSLNVRAVVDAEGTETGMFEVPAGGRRYRALELLVKQKRMAKTQSVPCVVPDAGERIIGRKVSATWLANVVAEDAPTLTPDAAFAALMEERTILELAGGFQLRRARVMGAHRIELSGFNDAMCDRLRAYGLFGEIISWKLRMFVPADASGVEILSKVLDSYPVARISEREAA